MVLMSVVYFFFFLMTRRPPRSTRTDTLFPHPPPCRSRAHDDPQCRLAAVRKPRTAVDTIRAAATTQERIVRRRHACLAAGPDRLRVFAQALQHLPPGEVRVRPRLAPVAGEQRRVPAVERRGHSQPPPAPAPNVAWRPFGSRARLSILYVPLPPPKNASSGDGTRALRRARIGSGSSPSACSTCPLAKFGSGRAWPL